MKKYLVSTTTHALPDGRQIDNWAGDYVDALTAEDAATDAANWEMYLLREDGAHHIELVGKSIFYRDESGAEFYREIQVDEV